MKSLILGLTVLAMAGCRNTIEGTLRVEKAFSAKSTQKLPCNPEAGDPCYAEKNIQVAPGQYTAKVSVNSGSQIEVQIKDTKTQTLMLQVPNNMTIPENGSFSVTSQQSGQPFDLNGVVTTTHQNSEVYRQRESCVVERWERECFETPHGRQCSTVLRTYPGFREVEFYYIDSLQVLDIVLTSAATRSPLAHFKGDKQISQKRYAYQGQCW